MKAHDLPKRKSHRLAPGVYATTEYEFYFTVCARHQGKPFANWGLADAVVESLRWTKRNYNWQLFCYCLMPDHLHFVCRLTDRDIRMLNMGARGEKPDGVLEHLARFKSYTTHLSWKFGFESKLWQKSSYDRVIDMMRPFEEIVEYTLRNPVRKGLVEDWTQWPYSRIVDPWW